MYHLRKNFTISALLTTFCSLSYAFSALVPPASAEHHPLATPPSQLTGNLNFISSDFASPPSGSALKKEPAGVTIYQFDNKPLGDRSPFLLVHGLHGEHFSYFRWQKVATKFNSNPEFASQFKIYMARYNTVALMDKTVPQFRKALNGLYQATGQRPITCLALSIGGNLLYESMLDKQSDNQVKVAMTLGTPFRGTPLFCREWVKYSMYKNLAWPWTRVDHSLAYNLYFGQNPNLLKDFRWDDSDDSIPDAGHFKSRLPLGPHGDLTVADSINERLIKLNSEPFDKKKLITYSGFLINPYMLPNSQRFVETTLMAPYTWVFMKVPAHLAREHPMLKLLNKQISSTVADKSAIERSGTPFVYQLNDGITPVSSALFLPKSAEEQCLSRESDLPKVKGLTDVRLARVFKNIDHLTFIDGYRPIRASSLIEDELNPQESPRQIFDWMLGDLLNTTKSADGKLAKE